MIKEIFECDWGKCIWIKNLLPIRIYELKMKGFKKQLGGFVGNVMELNI
jgi:hypothetical protein